MGGATGLVAEAAYGVHLHLNSCGWGWDEGVGSIYFCGLGGGVVGVSLGFRALGG